MAKTLELIIYLAIAFLFKAEKNVSSCTIIKICEAGYCGSPT